MLDGLFMLLTLSTVMAIASFLAGSLPLTFTLSHSQLRLISTVGMGILVGTSLIVIIPEGIETLYSASSASQTAHTHRALSTPPLSIRWPPATPWLSPRDPSNALPNPVIPANPDTPSTTPTPRATAAHRTPTPGSASP
ncbi:MAG: hypothetical protein FRX48_05022 [Lasallia pustulata]|uniref:Uncharacterized protein n=1 Tax=Lasallia pustulata TaxID=136370 RepID=A0A5M8PT16_9LECA|nr:MAG: hypothetical protein FRX48_05022 [Lasallia pustulata]